MKRNEKVKRLEQRVYIPLKCANDNNLRRFMFVKHKFGEAKIIAYPTEFPLKQMLYENRDNGLQVLAEGDIAIDRTKKEIKVSGQRSLYRHEQMEELLNEYCKAIGYKAVFEMTPTNLSLFLEQISETKYEFVLVEYQLQDGDRRADFSDLECALENYAQRKVLASGKMCIDMTKKEVSGRGQSRSTRDSYQPEVEQILQEKFKETDYNINVSMDYAHIFIGGW